MYVCMCHRHSTNPCVKHHELNKGPKVMITSPSSSLRLCLGCVECIFCVRACVCVRRRWQGEKGHKNKNVLQGEARGGGERGEEVRG